MLTDGWLQRRKHVHEMIERIPTGMWQKCENPKCNQMIYNKQLEKNLRVCPHCNHHFRLTGRERIAMLLDEGSLVEIDTHLRTVNAINIPGYKEKLERSQQRTGEVEAVITGEATIGGYPIVFGVTDSFFAMGSMGSVMGEKITRALERAAERRVPIVLVSGSGGGARMEEGLLSLMQMAKTCAAVARLREAGQMFISLLTHPTMGGVLASWASLGDVIIAEPRAMLGFAGPRVIQSTHAKVPPNMQTAEFHYEHGMIDLIVPRPELQGTLVQLVSIAYAAPWRVRAGRVSGARPDFSSIASLGAPRDEGESRDKEEAMVP